MDPDCAICAQPAIAQCSCEAKGLDIALRQAEHKMMDSIFSDIRTWVRGRAQDYILSYFAVLTTRRKDHHAETIRHITDRAAYYYNARPHPSEVAAVDAELKRGIDDDWKASVQRYPEVLEYFYGLVDLNLPSDEDPAVKDPPLSALGGARRKSSIHDRREGGSRIGGRRSVPPGGRRPGTAFAPPPPQQYGFGHGHGLY
ncbi:hypothetical protein BP6252_04053 [Coleophoma cylindrospora]|uniref:Uncharacterized protein n=1 Tax=Coleophoma cylindrospora TaxID=1849047 RepID=A0A3D8RZF6_9HELO|nr:hypothetical protein BP6252_04053 [Coleophoma cylindrospora]